MNSSFYLSFRPTADPSICLFPSLPIPTPIRPYFFMFLSCKHHSSVFLCSTSEKLMVIRTMPPRGTTCLPPSLPKIHKTTGRWGMLGLRPQQLRLEIGGYLIKQPLLMNLSSLIDILVFIFTSQKLFQY